MAGIGITLTCPVCQLPIALAHAIKVIAEPDGHLLVVTDDRALAMHTCFRVAR